jgi:tetratricopeptide (TPR) repeat protein
MQRHRAATITRAITIVRRRAASLAPTGRVERWRPRGASRKIGQMRSLRRSTLRALVALGSLALGACNKSPASAPAAAPQATPIVAASPAATASPEPASSPIARAERALDASRYAEAERLFSAELAGENATRARLGLGRVLLETGRYAEAEQTLVPDELEGDDARFEAAALKAESLLARGLDQEAEALLRPLSAEPLARRARLLLGELLLARGERSAASEVLLTLIDDHNEDRISEDDGPGMALVGRAAYLLDSPHDANDAFNAAERASPGDVRTLLWRAELFLSRHDAGHAEEVIGEVLEKAPDHAQALVWMANVKLEQSLDFDAARALVKRALELNPNLPRAYFVLAGLALRDLEFEEVQGFVERGLGINPKDLELWSMRGASSFLQDDARGLAKAREHVLAQSPFYTRFFTIVAEYAEWEHRYQRIVELMRDALAVDDGDAAVHAALGLNLIRNGDDAAGLTALRRSFAKDPFNVRVFNTLNLFEETIPKQYVSERRGRFVIRYPKAEAAVLDRYVPPLLERAWQKFVGYYGFTPSEPIGIELYTEREHFAVRTSGLPETAIQGVCFGKTLASLTPKSESFNLPMTLWHELAHVFHIQLSDSHVPRWLTEGMAEYETIVERPEWRREHDPDLFRAERAGRLPQVAAMNRAFSGAKDIQDMATAYYASSQIVVMLAERFGRPKLNRLLALQGKGVRGPQALEQAFGVPPAELDREFAGFLDRSLERYRHQFMPIAARGDLDEAIKASQAAPDDVDKQLMVALMALEGGQLPLARSALGAAHKLDPTDPDLRFLSARASATEGRFDDARTELQGLVQSGADGYAVQMALAEVAAAQKDAGAQRPALDAAHRHDPSALEPLKDLWRLAEEQKDLARASQVLEQLAALDQHDGAVYRRLLELLVQQKDYARAVSHGVSAIYADMESPKTHALYARALAGVGQHDAARFEFESALVCPGEPKSLAEAHLDYAEFLSQRGQAREAGQQRDQARALDADNPRLGAP